MNRSRIFIMLLLLTAAALVTAACSQEEAVVNFVELTDWQSYTVVRPDIADEATVQAAVSLVKAIEEATGVKPELATDWVKRGESAPTGTKEILVGATNRPESANVAYLDYEVGFVNDRVYINGGSDQAVTEAMEWFIANCVGETVRVPANPYTHREEYPLAGVIIDGTPLTDFAISTVTYTEQARALRDWLAEQTGVLPAESGDARIDFTVDASLNMLDVSVASNNDVLTLSVGENGLDIGRAVSLFKDALTSRESDTITLNEKRTIEMEQIKTCDQAQLNEWRKMTDERIEKILSTPNMEIPDNKVVFYVSPDGDDSMDGKSPETAWKTLDKVNNAALAPGMYVCFERGGVWRGHLQAKAGVTYTAYGEGDKPMITRSLYDGTKDGEWELVADNIYRYSIKIADDVGAIVVNGGETYASRTTVSYADPSQPINYVTKEPFNGYMDLTEDMTFWHDLGGAVVSNPAGGYVYFCSTEGNPAERFEEIEFNMRQNVITIEGNDVTIDNLCVKYGGCHGVGAGSVNGLTVQNCEFGWIGGSLQHYNDNGTPTLFGNAVEIYGGCDGFYVRDNYIYQAYDAGITQQARADVRELYHKNVYYTGNVIEYCNYNIEYFLSKTPEDNPSRIENFVIEDNYMWYAGRGLCEQRHNKGAGSHIRTHHEGNRAVDYVIRNNMFIETREQIFLIASDRLNPDGSDSKPMLENNIFAAQNGVSFGYLAMNSTAEQRYAPAIIDYLGENTNGDLFYFFDKDVTFGWEK